MLFSLLHSVLFELPYKLSLLEGRKNNASNVFAYSNEVNIKNAHSRALSLKLSLPEMEKEVGR